MYKDPLDCCDNPSKAYFLNQEENRFSCETFFFEVKYQVTVNITYSKLFIKPKLWSKLNKKDLNNRQ